MQKSNSGYVGFVFLLFSLKADKKHPAALFRARSNNTAAASCGGGKRIARTLNPPWRYATDTRGNVAHSKHERP